MHDRGRSQRRRSAGLQDRAPGHLDRAGPHTEFQRRQGVARRDYQARRLLTAPAPGRRRLGRRAVRRAERNPPAVAGAAARAAGDQSRHGGTGQQDRPHGVEDHDQRPALLGTDGAAGIKKAQRADKLGRSRGLTPPAGRHRRRGKPIRASALRARAPGRDPSSRKALWPAAPSAPHPQIP